MGLRQMEFNTDFSTAAINSTEQLFNGRIVSGCEIVAGWLEWSTLTLANAVLGVLRMNCWLE